MPTWDQRKLALIGLLAFSRIASSPPTPLRSYRTHRRRHIQVFCNEFPTDKEMLWPLWNRATRTVADTGGRIL